ncbi:MAG TPA: hypothetical protein DEO83_06205, partial [Lachnospiraceae bacterium]|nr:hypothetical protein [Lachnospiraceae bacterium]
MESNKKRSFSTPTLLKRALAYLLVTAMVISGFNMVPMAKLTAEAADLLAEGTYVMSMNDFSAKVTVTQDNGTNYLTYSGDDIHNLKMKVIKKNGGFLLYRETFEDYVYYDGNENKLSVVSTEDEATSVGYWSIKEAPPFEAGNYKVTNWDYPAFTYNGTISVEGTDNYLRLQIEDNRIYNFRVKNTESGYLLLEGEDIYACIWDGKFFHPANSEDIEIYEDTICEYWDIEPIPNTTVTFDKNADDATGTTESKTFENGKVVNAVENGFSRTGYSFDGYYTEAGTKVFDSNGKPCKAADYIEVESGEEGEEGEDTNIYTWICTASELTLYAHWKRIYTDVTFDGNAKDNADKASAFFAPEGDVAKPTSVKRTLNVGDSFATAMPIPERKGFKFDGYYTDATNGKMVFDAEGKPYIKADQESVQDSAYFAVSDDKKVTWKYLKEGNEDADKKLTLYAHWSRAYTNVTFDKNATKAKF